MQIYENISTSTKASKKKVHRADLLRPCQVRITPGSLLLYYPALYCIQQARHIVDGSPLSPQYPIVPLLLPYIGEPRT